MQKCFIVLVVLFIHQSTLCQNAAHTATKINAISAVSIDEGWFEFEPNFSSIYQYQEWDDKGDRARSFSGDSINVQSDLGFRFQYAPIQGMEVASFIPADVSEAYLGLKYIFIDSSTVDMCAYFGGTFPMGNRTVRINNRNAEDLNSFGLGIGLTRDFTDRFSLDFSAEYQRVGLAQEQSTSDFFAFMDIGYHASDNLLLMSSFGYQNNAPELFRSWKFSVYPGLAIESSEKFRLMVNGQVDMTGRNARRVVGGNMALTLIFE